MSVRRWCYRKFFLNASRWSVTSVIRLRTSPRRTSTSFDLKRMDGGGVYLNVGSAVVLPEVFLKCVTLVRNLGHPLTNITTANFDFIQSYRPITNVVRRPTEKGAGEGFSITGHHELTIPLLAALLTQTN